MHALIQSFRCSNPDCKVAETGSCTEGHEPRQSCPNFGHALAAQTDLADIGQAHQDDVDEAERREEQQIPLPSGEALSSEKVERFLRWREATFISIVGDSFSGKTTLVTAIYDRLLRGPFANAAFTGSWTLPALERLSHYARVESGQETPETPRTSILDGLSYLHLALSDQLQIPRRRVDLLMSDRAGETYRRARDNSKSVVSLTEIPQAARVVLLLDGAKVAKLEERAGAMQSTRQMLRVLVDNQAIGKNTAVQVVTTKVDVLKSQIGQENSLGALSTFYAKLRQDFEERLGQLSFWEIAARDPSGKHQPAHGVDKLLRDWITPTKLRHPIALHHEGLVSQFDRLLVRTPEVHGL